MSTQRGWRRVHWGCPLGFHCVCFLRVPYLQTLDLRCAAAPAEATGGGASLCPPSPPPPPRFVRVFAAPRPLFRAFSGVFSCLGSSPPFVQPIQPLKVALASLPRRGAAVAFSCVPPPCDMVLSSCCRSCPPGRAPPARHRKEKEVFDQGLSIPGLGFDQGFTLTPVLEPK